MIVSCADLPAGHRDGCPASACRTSWRSTTSDGCRFAGRGPVASRPVRRIGRPVVRAHRPPTGNARSRATTVGDPLASCPPRS
ncbi:hypothetical protein HBB16_19900 [Pseudonocardia sp. MCCB 268]|nr:hypothetical protein [Pseudonocardia cytotoxica]